MATPDMSASAVGNLINNGATQAAAALEAAPATPTKKTPKKPRKPSAKKKALTENGDNGENSSDVVDPPTPKAKPTPKKRTPKAKAIKVEGEENGEASGAVETATSPEPIAKNSGKKRAFKTANGEGETPSKKQRTKSNGVPESLSEFSESDLLIVNMRKEGKDWAEITAAWAELNGKEPGKDVLRKRLPKLQAVLQEWKEGDAEKLAIAKRRVEEDHIVEVKKFEQTKWAKISEALKAAGSDEYKPAAIEKKWENMMKQGHVDAAGNYQGPELNAATTGEAESSDAANDQKAEAEGKGEDEAPVQADGESHGAEIAIA